MTFCLYTAIAGPVIGCVLGVLNVAALFMVVILFAVMGQDSTKQQRNMARSEPTE